MLFGALPHVSSALRYNPDASESAREAEMGEVVEEQDRQSEMLMRIFDLRNAGRARINVVNTERVVQEFGGGWDTGSSGVQGEFEFSLVKLPLILALLWCADGMIPTLVAAILTTKIRGLNEHVLANPKDVHNQKALREMVQKRAKILKYLKRKKPDDYEKTLADCGLDKRAVEGELVIRI